MGEWLQRNVSVRQKGMMVNSKVKNETNEYVCEKCGTNRIRLVSHMDSVDGNITVYVCENGHETVTRVDKGVKRGDN